MYPLDTVLSLPKILTFEILSCNVLPAPILITFCCVSLYLLLPKTIILGLTTTCSWVFQDTSSPYASKPSKDAAWLKINGSVSDSPVSYTL